MGYLRDDTPLIELILDEKGKKELDRLWDEFDFIADYTARTWIQYFFNQSGEVHGQRPRVRQRAAVGQGCQRAARSFSSCGTLTWRRREAEQQSGRDGSDPRITSTG